MNVPSQLVSRRRALKATALGFGHLAFGAMLSEQSQAGQAARNPLPHFAARAKRIVFLYMKGGPSHVDTFDPKPLLDRDHMKPPPFELPAVTFAKQGNLLKSPWKFRQYGESGLPVSDLFPRVARHIDDLCILRSVHGTNPAHGGALLKLHTGSDQFVRPSMGAWVSYGLGTENQNLPAFITICPTLAHGGMNNWGAAFLPAYCQGTPIGTASQAASTVQVKNIHNPRIDSELQRRQLDLLSSMNRRDLESMDRDAALEGRLQSYELAYRMQSVMPEAQDLTRESAATHQLYGVDDPVTENFGRQCLMARRFLERGVRFVQVTHSDSEVQWD
ncbi:sulfatase, partial [Planctomyces sp. SCGC AG-212-M04]